MQNQNMQNQVTNVVYTNEQIAQLMQVLNSLQISGVQNIKAIATVMMILESPITFNVDTNDKSSEGNQGL